MRREKTRRQQKSVSLFLYVPHDKSNQSTILLFLYCMFLLCVYRYVYLYSLPHRIWRVPGFLSICLNWAPSSASECCSPLWVQEGRHTRLRGMGDPIPTKGQTLWYYMYTIIPLRLANTAFVNFVTAGTWNGTGYRTMLYLYKKITKKYSNKHPSSTGSS